MRQTILSLSFILCAFGTPAVAPAQMVMMQSPLQSNGSSFYEYSNVGWGIRNPNYFMRFNGGGGAPPFGGYQPNAGLSGGFAVGNAQFNFGFGQGASLVSTSATPVLTTTNGYPGYLFVGRSRPFVTGVSPLVGGGFGSVPPMSRIANQMATGQLRTEHGQIVDAENGPDQIPPAPNPEAGVREAVRPLIDHVPPAPGAGKLPAKTAGPSAAEYMRRAVAAEQEGRLGVAKIYYQLAATNGDGLTRAQAAQKLDDLKSGFAGTRQGGDNSVSVDRSVR